MNENFSQLHKLRIERDANEQAPRRGWVIGGGVALTLLLLLVGSYLAFRSFVTPRFLAVRVAIAQSRQTGISSGETLDASGYVTALRQSTVSAKITGKLAQVLVQEGQRVEAGQVIARLDDTDSAAALGLARANLRSATLAYDDAKPIYERADRLFTSNVSSAQAFDQAKAAYDTASANVGIERAALDVAERNEDNTIIRAPFSGIITDKTANEGEIVSPISAGGGFTRTGICTIVDMQTLQVEVDVNENYIDRIRPEQAAVVRLGAYPDWSIPAKVVAVIPTADRAKETVKVRLSLDRMDPRILPEMSANVTFQRSGQNVGAPAPLPGVLIPRDAIRARGDVGTVFVIDEGKLVARTVRMGAMQGSRRVVLSGLSEGDRVAVGELSHFYNGEQVTVSEGTAE